MERLERWKEGIAAVLIMLSFFGVFYPEFTLAGDAYYKLEQDVSESGSSREDYYRILNASEGEVEIRLSFLDEKKGKSINNAKKAFKVSENEKSGRIE